LDGLQIAHNNNKKAAEESVGWRIHLRYALLPVDSEGRVHHDERRRDVPVPTIRIGMRDPRQRNIDRREKDAGISTP